MTGFVLIEVIISVLIASFLSVGLLTTIMQVSRVQQTVTTITNINGRMAILQNQMERDIMGAFVPTQIDMIQTATTTAQPSPQKPVEKVFYGTSKGNGGRLDLLTFITSNPLEVFYGVKNVQLKPRIARVVYRLVPDERRKNAYILMRQEGTTDLTFEKYKTDSTGELRSFAMVDDIQNLTVSYITVEQSTEEPKKPRTYKRSSSWQSEQKKETTTPPKGPSVQKEPVRLPNYVEVVVSLWNSSFTDTRTFTLVIPIAYKTTEFQEPPKEKAKPEETPTAAPTAPTSQPPKVGT